MELDNKICDLIERNASFDPKGVTPGAMLSHKSLCPVKVRKHLLSTISQYSLQQLVHQEERMGTVLKSFTVMHFLDGREDKSEPI